MSDVHGIIEQSSNADHPEDAMARRYSASQIKSMMRQAEQKQRKAISDYNNAAKKYNREVKKAVSDYNRQVNDHNARVRANRRRLQSELSRLSSTPSTHYVTYRTSVGVVAESFARLETRSEQGLGEQYHRVLDLSEREAANSIATANRLMGTAPEAEEPDTLENEELREQLKEISPDLDDRWRGALFALSPSNPDAARHFCTSAREIFVKILDLTAPDRAVLAATPDAPQVSPGVPTRRAKLRHLLHRSGLTDPTLEDFADADMEDILQLFRVFNDGTHGGAGTFDGPQLTSIRKRVEDGIVYLTALVSAA